MVGFAGDGFDLNVAIDAVILMTRREVDPPSLSLLEVAFHVFTASLGTFARPFLGDRRLGSHPSVHTRSGRDTFLFTLGFWLVAAAIVAQEPGSGSQPRLTRSAGNPKSGPPRAGVGKPAPAKGGAADGENAKGKESQEDEEKDEKIEVRVIRRDAVDGFEADPDELNVRVDDDGKVGFQFRQQGWVDLVRWLSDITDEPIDWQELPADTVNLVSPERLSVSETVDLFNRHLLTRGYTMLRLDGGITIVNTGRIDPGMVQRLSVDALETTGDHTFVRVLLDAGWLSAEKLAEELQAMLSPAGKLTPLATTNRLEAMDVAVNLRIIAKLLGEERDAASRDALAPEFRLRHIPAEEAKTLLEDFLGVKEEKAAPMTPEQMQMMQRMAQQNGGKLPNQKPKADISIVANVRQNSVLIRAPIDRVVIASEFIKRIDVPGSALSSLADATSRVDVFRLVSLDPDKLIQIALDMNVLEPTTRIQTDAENQAVIVSGSAADRFIIKSLIERLDGGKRRFEVLQLRRLSATEVAESIAFLMGDDDDDDDDQPSRRYFYYGYSSKDDEKDEDRFRVAANVRFRQILLWANESEMNEVRSLLVKLGELPPPGGSRQTTRMIEATATPATLEYLRRIQRQWESMSDIEIVLPDAELFRDEIMEQRQRAIESDRERDESTSPESAIETTDVTVNGMAPVGLGHRHSVPSVEPKTWVRAQSSMNQDGVRPSTVRPRIVIQLDPMGNLVLRGDDTRALDALEGLMLQFDPPRRPFHVFKVEHASASLIALDLEDYFRDDHQEGPSQADRFYSWYFDMGSDEDDSPAGLGRDGSLKFLPNSDTGTVVVTGASSAQLRTIGELVMLWDVPEPINPRRGRFTKLVAIRYGRAASIAETIKDAYRDLLSSNDKVFQTTERGRGDGSGASRSNRARGSELADVDSDNDGGSSDFSFSGKLSLGIDEVGNTLLISAEGEPLLELIVSMVDKLDQAARPGGEIEVVQMKGEVSSAALQSAIDALGGDSTRRQRGGESMPRGGPASGARSESR